MSDLPPLETPEAIERTQALLRQQAVLVGDYWEALRAVIPEDLAKDLVRDWHASTLIEPDPDI